MLRRWIPWKTFLRRTARRHGILDPLSFLGRLRRFAQPSEIAEPLELLREGVKFHARGLINTRAIQHNLDWIWPFWIERQFNPTDPSFIPRAFSFSHVNLTHRNWTAVGLPNRALYPIVDPRGLVTPLHDGWSVDFWVEGGDGRRLVPSRAASASQRQQRETRLTVTTEVAGDDLTLTTRVWLQPGPGGPELVIAATGTAPGGGALIAALRPYNPEGIQFIDRIRYDAEARTWQVNDRVAVFLSTPPSRVAFSTYQEGDVALQGPSAEHAQEVACPVGMATAAAYFPIEFPGPREVRLRVPLRDTAPAVGVRPAPAPPEDWPTAVEAMARLEVPEARFQSLYDAALTTLLLLSAEDIVPGPFTYRRFWFRDACLMLQALLAIGGLDRCRRILGTFPTRQKKSGYFHSQNGEWDSNGQVLWIFGRFQRASGEGLDPRTLRALQRGADWIRRKRLPADLDAPHAGLLPAGFSAEHFGPNDFYYWDDFWAVAGLRALARISRQAGDLPAAAAARRLAEDLHGSIARSLAAIPRRRSRGGLPASPYRRLDAGAVGSLVADYPLQLTPPGDPRILRTVNHLLDHALVGGAFFMDVVHSGVNAYLTLAIAQTLLRAGDGRYADLMREVARLASPTGHWPEAIHPATRGGCMGDGQHGWAAAEWVMMMRHLFVREEGSALVIGAGLLPAWLKGEAPLAFGPTPTPWGPVTVLVAPRAGRPRVTVEADFAAEAPVLTIALPGFRVISPAPPNTTCTVAP